MGQTSDTPHSSAIEPVNPRRPLSTPWVRGQLIVDLAIGEQTQTALAEKYGVTQGAIGQFKKRYSPQIEDRQQRLMDDYQDLWIADKKSRLAARQALAEELGLDETTPRTAEVIDKLLNSAAEELGELQSKVSVEIAEYRITGIDLDRV